MIATKQDLEFRVNNLNSWLKHHPVTHHLYRQYKQRKHYYIVKLGDMDELNLKTIKI